ncbi:MAG: malate dehydrogenase [Candidatus Omnitrophota bacterium]|jgi:malate dehydrogenase|nr:MAG: malate dehydrogenase [Candidatus Omnitrophota bacterium]
MKISIVGAGNVGSLAAFHIVREGLGEVVLLDVAGALAKGKALDLEDACAHLGVPYHMTASDDISALRDSDIVVITAGFARKPGMTREELLDKNAHIVKDLSLAIKKHAPRSIVIVVTNPLDVMTYLVLRYTAFFPSKVFGMGPSLDAARFRNLISQAVAVSSRDIETTVIGTHGESMLPLPRFTYVKGIALDEFLDDKQVQSLLQRTKERGKEIVSFLGTGSAYFAPSLCVAELVSAIAKDQKRTIGVSALLQGEYGLKNVCIGVPCLLGGSGIEKIIELKLNGSETAALTQSAESLRALITRIP